MQNLTLNIQENSFHMIHRIKQLNVLIYSPQKTLIILLINLYNRTSIISFYSKSSHKKILSDFDPLSEILKIKLTDLKTSNSFLKAHKNDSYLLILTPYSIILYNIFQKKKLREIHLEHSIISHKNSFDDFLIIPLEKEEITIEISNQTKIIPKFLIMTSSNDCLIKVWNLLKGTQVKSFNSLFLNKQFIHFPMNKVANRSDISYLASVFHAKNFNLTKIEINIWDWKRGDLKKTLKNGLNFRSILQMDYINLSEFEGTLLLMGGIENDSNYGICVFDWENEIYIKKIKSLVSFSYFLWKHSNNFCEKEVSCEKIITFSKNFVIRWDLMGVKEDVLMECGEDFFNFTAAVGTKKTDDSYIAKGLNVYSL